MVKGGEGAGRKRGIRDWQIRMCGSVSTYPAALCCMLTFVFGSSVITHQRRVKPKSPFILLG